MSMPPPPGSSVSSRPSHQLHAHGAQPDPQQYHAESGPKLSRSSKIVGIVSVSLAGLLVAGLVVNRLVNSGERTVAYRLTVPKTMLDGTFRLSDDGSQTRVEDALQGTSDPTPRPKLTTAQYTGGSPELPRLLVLSGLSGHFMDPESDRTNMLQAATGGSMTVTVQPQDVTPPDSDITLRCQVAERVTESAGRITVPMCAWADSNTTAAVAVAEISAENPQPAPQSIDLNKTAATTLKVRAEIRQPTG